MPHLPCSPDVNRILCPCRRAFATRSSPLASPPAIPTSATTVLRLLPPPPPQRMNTYLLRHLPSRPCLWRRQSWSPLPPTPLGEAETFRLAIVRALVAVEFRLLEPYIKDTGTTVLTKLRERP